MIPPRRRVRDDELPDLPPLDGDDAPADLDVGDDPGGVLEDGPVSLDDAAAEELSHVELDEADDGGERDDGARGGADDDVPVDVGDDADGVLDDGEVWRGEAEDVRGEADDIDALDALPPDDGGVEGLEGDVADVLDALPPMDGDGDDEDTADDGEVVFFQRPPWAPGVTVRKIASMSLDTAPGVCIGVDHVFAVGDRLWAWPMALLDDPDASPLALDGPEGATLCAVSEDVARTLTVAEHGGALWRRSRARDPWRRLRWTGDTQGDPVSLAVGPTGLWVCSARGELWRERVGRFNETLAGERVRALSVDAQSAPSGSVIVALSGRRRDGVRVSDDGVTWSVRPTPETLDLDVVARVGEVLAVAGLERGFVSLDGGARWAPWPMLAGATALCVGEADDGDAWVFAAVFDGDRALVVMARVGADGGAEAPATLCDVSSIVSHSARDDEPPRVERLIAVDRAGRRILLAVTSGAVLLVTRDARDVGRDAARDARCLVRRDAS